MLFLMESWSQMIKTKINDFYHRTIIRIKLLFIKDEETRRELLICLGLNSENGRKELARAMIWPLINTYSGISYSRGPAFYYNSSSRSYSSSSYSYNSSSVLKSKKSRFFVIDLLAKEDVKIDG